MDSLPDVLKIHDRFTVIPLSSNVVLLHSLTNTMQLRDDGENLISRLLPLLDGTQSLSDILAQLQQFDAESVVATLEQMMAAGILDPMVTAGNGLLSQEELARYHQQLVFFSHFVASEIPGQPSPWPDIPRSPVEYQEKLKRATITVFGLGQLGSQLVRALAIAGVGHLIVVDDHKVEREQVYSNAWFDEEHLGQTRSDVLGQRIVEVNPYCRFTSLNGLDWSSRDQVVDAVSGSNLAVLATDHVSMDEYDTLNQACLDSETMWTSCRLNGFELNIGPTVIPYKTPCYKCFDLRLKSNLANYEEQVILESHMNGQRGATPSLAITPGIGLVALEIIKAVTYFMEPATFAHLFAINLLTMESKLHPILKIPRCPHCGLPSHNQPTIHIWQQQRGT